MSAHIVLHVLIVLLIVNIKPAAFASNNHQCFTNPQAAYDYLTLQEQAATNAQSNKVVNINTATEAELTTLNGIGSSKAQAIIAYRNQYGSFKTVDELIKVKGIGEKIVQNNRARLTVD